MIKKTLSVLFVLCLVFSVFACSKSTINPTQVVENIENETTSNNDSNASNTNQMSKEISDIQTENINSIKTITEYSNDTTIDQMQTVKFGTYPQSDESGITKEPIEWIVLDRKDDKVFLLSKYILDCKTYNSELYETKHMIECLCDEYPEFNEYVLNSNINVKNCTIVELESFIVKLQEDKPNLIEKMSDFAGSLKSTWESSELRDFLNNEFYNRAFETSSKEIILEVENNNTVTVEGETINEPNTKDKVFYIAENEFVELLRMSSNQYQDNRIATKGTKYAQNVVCEDSNQSKLYVDEGDANRPEWAIGNSNYFVRHFGIYVNSCGFFGGPDSLPAGVRPAIWVKYQ